MAKPIPYSNRMAARRLSAVRIVKFVLVGGSGTALQYLVLIVLVSLGRMAPGRAAVVGALAGACVVYLLNRRFTFDSQRRHRETLPRFALMAAVGTLLNGMLVGTLSGIGLYYLLAQAAATLVVLVFNYILSKTWIFR